MGKVIKWLAGILLVLVLLVVAAVIVLPLVIDPNDYKQEIVQAVREETGRELSISEPLDLSVFPWLGIAAGGVSLSNAAGFGDQPFASLGALQLKVKLLPLLSRTVQVDTIVLRDLTLNLARDASGKSNWDDLAGKDKPAEQEAAPERREGGAVAVDIEGVEVVNARVVWDDRQAKARYVLKDVNLTAGALSAGSTAPLAMGLVLDMGEQGPLLSLDLKGTVTVRDDLMGYSMPDLALLLKGEGGGLPKPLEVKLDAALDADLAAERVSLSKLVTKVDDSTLTGNVTIGSFAGPAVQLRLDLDQIDLDRYLPASEGEQAAAAPSAKPADDPLAGLRTLELDGQVNVGRLKVKNLTITDVKVTVTSKDGVLRVDPLQALLYDGRLSGRAELDARRKTPRLAVSNQLAGIQAGPLLKDLLGEERLTGAGEVQSDLRMTGFSEQEIRNSLNGTAQFAFRDGAVKGVNVAQLIRKAQAAMSGGSVPDEPQQTDFTELSGSAKITNGVIDNQDLAAKSPLLRIGGKGQVNLPADTVNYVLTAELVKSLEGQGGKGAQDLTGLPIPVRVKGKLTDPGYSVDLESVLQSKVKQEAQKKIESAIQDKAGDKVKGLLKGLGL
jgi:AsmA protein